MKIKFNACAVLQTKWCEYVVRFVIGGGITVMAGIIADRFGPAVGGLFLAFPAIFPASATLIEKHERQKKERAGLDPGNRGRLAVALDAAGATGGGIATVTFAALVWLLLPHHATWSVLVLGVLVWLTTAVIIWRIADAL
jgi:Protein of unknown function (DUF3147)